jgi:hypothetical protein
MTMGTESVGAGMTVVLDEPVSRATPEGVEGEFRGILRGGADALLAGVETATRSLPGGAVVSAAIGGIESAVTGGGTSGAGGMDDVLARSAMNQMELLELQARMQDENARFTTLSNVLKAEHETAKTAIGNIR